MTSFIAALPMYDWPEVRSETDALWAALRDALRATGVNAPEGLARRNADLLPVPGGIHDVKSQLIAPDPATLPPDGFDLPTLWRHPALLLAQTCWGPMGQGLGGEVRVVGQPDYSRFEGGEGEFYSSAILTRRREAPAFEASRSDALIPAVRSKRFAFNGLDSMSGLIAFEQDLVAVGQNLEIFSERIETGSHRASIRAVAEDRADICTVDCRTWDLAKRFEPAAEDLTVIGWTRRRKGLPYIASRHLPDAVIDSVRRAFAATESRSASR
ncbi:MAG: PhnD/SsuA/transferrin family substrate-binding protein [Methylobacterium mesophilicum]|nr:PhnD/SsuA/transferrin family substrate-binding protein [Methylobacterium mesophilicum]